MDRASHHHLWCACKASYLWQVLRQPVCAPPTQQIFLRLSALCDGQALLNLKVRLCCDWEALSTQTSNLHFSPLAFVSPDLSDASARPSFARLQDCALSSLVPVQIFPPSLPLWMVFLQAYSHPLKQKSED